MADVLVAQQYARGLVRLLKEYAGKLQAFAADGGRYSFGSGSGTGSGSYSRSSYSDPRVQSIRPALLNMTREASQLAEQGDVGDLDRLELRLRLAEVEGLLRYFEQG